MVGRLAHLRDRLHTSIWLIPAGLCVSSALLAALMLWLDRHFQATGFGFAAFSMSLDSARQLLGIIAASIISVGGVAFSVTMVALTLTSGQYGPKILRNFLEDRASKLSLGLFLGTYVYTLIILSGYAQSDEPRFSVLAALLLALLALTGFVHFIHRTATDLQADEIINRIGEQMQHALRGLVKDAGTSGRTGATLSWRQACRLLRPTLVASYEQGYVQTIDYAQLVHWCASNECMLQVRVRAGDFIVEHVCLFKVYGCDAATLETALDDLKRHIVVGPIRTPIQDQEHTISQLIQLAARALSPGINDPGTAITCIDWFSLALAQIVDRDIPGCVLLDQAQRPRILARVHNFPGIMKAVYAPLRQLAGSNIAVTASLIESLCRLAELTRRADRLKILAMHGDLIWNELSKQPLPQYDLRDIQQRHRKLRSLTSPLPESQATAL